MFKIQYSHDKFRWFDYGADAVKPGTLFPTMEEAQQIFKNILSSYIGLIQFLRIVDKEGCEVVEPCRL